MNKLFEEDHIQAVADAIRSKTYDDSKIKLSEMAEKIQSVDKYKGLDIWMSGQWAEKVSKTLICYSKYAVMNPLIFIDESGNNYFPFLSEGKVVFPNATAVGCDGCRELHVNTVDFYKLNLIRSYGFRIAHLKNIIIRTKTVCTLENQGFRNIHFEANAGIYVPDELVDDYKTAENWTAYAEYIKPLSDLEGVQENE